MSLEDDVLLESTTLRIAGAVNESIVDGPGIRYVIFTQGCPFHCEGCHNPQSQPLKGGLEVKLSVLYQELKHSPLVDGVTFSGGEPFLQASSLAIMAKILKDQGYSLWSYTGFVYEELILEPDRRELLQYLDVLVDGPFMLAKRSLMIDFRGSTNQRLIDVPKTMSQGKVVIKEGYV